VPSRSESPETLGRRRVRAALPKKAGGHVSVPEQLTIDDEIADDLSFGEWMLSLPVDLEEEHAPDQDGFDQPEAQRWLEEAA
jgi:hypothetical protein